MTETITSAFLEDPLWSPVFGLSQPGLAEPDRTRLVDRYRSWWRLFVDGAFDNGSIWASEHCEAVAIWLLPGAAEFGPEQEAQAEDLITAMTVAEKSVLAELDSLFQAARPPQAHHYLTLLGTHRDHRGHGIGMALLEHTLTWVDTTGDAAYLESTNPANLTRYTSVGFEPLGGFAAAGGAHVTTMWRPPRHAREEKHAGSQTHAG